MRTLFALNPALDRPAIAAALARHGRVQIRDALQAEAAEAIHEVLARSTDWGLAWGASDGTTGHIGEHLRGASLRAMPAEARARFGAQAATAAAEGRFAFLYAQYPMVEAYLKGWSPGHPLDLLLEHLNSPEMLDFAREVSGVASIIKADAQATLYAPGHFLTAHDDAHQGEGRRVAYVLSLARGWRADWGGLLNFLDAGDDVIEGLLPRFNTLNLFTVPQQHNVSSVAPFAPMGRFSITGWFRDR